MAKRSISDADDARNYPSPGFAWYAVFCLLLCSFMFWVDRNILTLLVAPVRQDLGINDSQMGILQGFSFSALSSLMSIPYGWLADRGNRRKLLIFGIGLWGCSTIASGFTTTFTELLWTRMGLGIGEAVLAPAAFSLIADLFPKARRGRAVGIYGVGGFAGIGLSYLIGGAVLAAFRGRSTVELPLIGGRSLWHAAFITVGFATLLLCLLLLTVREPARLGNPVEAERAGDSFFGYLRHHVLSFCLVIGAYGCLGIVAIGWFAWLPTYFIREFQYTPLAAGIQVGWVTTVSGVLGAFAGGYIADAMARRGMRGGKLPTLVILFATWIPCAIGIWLSHDPRVALFWVFIFTFVDGIGFAQYANVMQEMFPPQMRARAISAWTVCSSALTYGTGPLMFGLATDFLFAGPAGLRYSLGLISLPVMVLGLLLSWLGRGPYDRTRFSLNPAADADRVWIEGGPAVAPARRS